MSRSGKILLALAALLLLLVPAALLLVPLGEPVPPWRWREQSALARFLDSVGLRGGMRDLANDAAARATLRNVSSAQAQFQSTGILDLDRDGVGEYGTFAELSGAAPVRGAARMLNPPVLSGAFQPPIVRRAGFRFDMVLPDRPDDAEGAFLCLARPLTPGSRCWTYLLTQDGDLFGRPDAVEPGSGARFDGATRRFVPDGSGWQKVE